MQRGLRLTTGAEFAPIDALPTPVQLALSEPLPEPPWRGRLLAEMVQGEKTWVDPTPYLPARFA